METINEEKSLITVDNGIFARMRRFFRNIFSRKNDIQYDEDISNESAVKETQYKDDEYTQPKLFNYDDPKNYYGKENNENSTVSAENSTDVNTFNNGEVVDNTQKDFTNISSTDNYNQNVSVETQESNVEQEPTTNQYVGISKYFEDVDDNYIGKSKRKVSEKREDGYECKEELEQKLMNYYASIKKVIQ